MKKINLLLIVPAIILILSSCSNTDKTKEKNTKADVKPAVKKYHDDELSSFMLGGIYFIHGYGGQSEVNSMIRGTTDEDVIEEYKEILEFPFKPGESDAKSTLSEWWNINSKADLEETLIDLRDDTTVKHKAWDYTRLVNNAAMGYAAGYLTKSEVKKYLAQTLPLARKKFKNWEEYFADWNAGRKEWGGDKENEKEWESLSLNITKGYKNIYQLLPLN